MRCKAGSIPQRDCSKMGNKSQIYRTNPLYLKESLDSVPRRCKRIVHNARLLEPTRTLVLEDVLLSLSFAHHELPKLPAAFLVRYAALTQPKCCENCCVHNPG